MATENTKKQSKRNVIMLEDKIKILNRIKNVEKVSSVAKSLNLNTSTVQTIHRNENKIRKSVAEGYSNGAQVAHVRDVDLIKMEKAVMIWFEDCVDKKIPLSGFKIKQKALKIYRYLKQIENSSAEQPSGSFAASDGWLDKFKKRFSLHNILQGEQASVNTEAANKFKQEIHVIIETEGYSEDQIFNADETAIYWRKLPSRIHIFTTHQRRAPRYKACKERVTLLMCSNVAGNYLKPLVVHCSVHSSRIMKNVNMSQLSVFWYNNAKAWMTADIFKQWFLDYFVPSVEDHMKKKNLSFKALLIVDNATSHMKDLHHPNIKIIFLPPNCTSLIQPLDQGIIHAFKAIYIRLSYETIFNRLKENENKTLLDAWKEFSIKEILFIVTKKVVIRYTEIASNMMYLHHG